MRSTPLRRAVAASIAAGALVGASAAPAAGAISLAPVRPCLSELDAVSPNAAGLTPSGPVKLDLVSSGRPLLSTSSQPAAADGTYKVAQPYSSSVTDKWFPDATTETIPLSMTVTDLTRLNAGVNPATGEVTASAALTFSRWGVFIGTVGGRIPTPRGRIRFRALGWTNAINGPLYLPWIRGGTEVHRERLGGLRGPCGSLTKTLQRAFPFRPVPAGQYRLLFSTSLTNPVREPAVLTALITVRRRDAIPAR